MLLLALAGCSRSAPEDAAFQRLAWTRQADAAPLPPPPEPIVLELPAELSSWPHKLKAGGPLEVDGQRRLRIEQGGRVTIPGPFQGPDVASVEVRGELIGDLALHVAVRAGEREWSEQRSVRGSAQREPLALAFDFPQASSEGAPIDALVLTLYAPTFDLAGVSLRAVDILRALPPPEAPGAITVGIESRLACEVASTQALDLELRPRRGDRLVFALAQPAWLRTGPDAPRASLSLRAQGAQRTVELAFERAADGSVAWSPQEVDVGDLAGRDVHARLTLAAADGRLCAMGVDAPALVPRADPAQPGAARPADAPFPATVLLVTSDTHRADHVAAYRPAWQVATPAIDDLAARGVLFEDCYSAANATLPSHSSIMTGAFPRDTGVVDNQATLASTYRTLAEAFREAGYTTLAVVSAEHLGPRTSGMVQGFDRMASPQGFPWSASAACDLARAWIAESDGRPLFVWLHLFEAHSPYLPPPEFDRLYYPKDKDPRDPSLPDPNMPADTAHRADLEGVRDLEFPVAQYRAEVTYLDHALSSVFDLPRVRAGITAFTADHGEIFHHHGYFFDHNGLWPDTLHVPMVLAWPGAPQGRRSAREVQNTDVGRTLLDLAGLEAAQFPGTNLVRDVDSNAPAPRFAMQVYARSASITLGRLTLVKALRDFGDSPASAMQKHQVLLFDRVADPEGKVDLTSAEPEQARRLHQALVQWLADAHGGPNAAASTQASEEELQRLQALGYAADAQPFGADEWIDPECGCPHCRALR